MQLRRQGAAWPAIGRSVAAAVVVVAAAAGVAVALTTGTAATGYRTAVVGDAPVTKTVTVTGTVEPVHRVTLAFGVSGTVATVAVHVGERVTAGQTLATLQATSLAQQVAQAEAALHAAQAAVTADEQRQAAAAGRSTAPPTTAPGGASGTPGSTSTGATGTSTPTALQAAQQAVVHAQKAADAAAQAASTALATADAACGTIPPSGGKAPAKGSSPTTTTTTTTSPSTTTTTTPGTTTTTTTTTPGTDQKAACATALHSALTAQKALAADQQAVAQAETALAALLAQGGAPSGSGTSSPTRAVTTPATGASGSTGGAGGTGAANRHATPGAAATTTATGTGVTLTSGATAASTPATPKAAAARLANDQSTVDTADATLLVDQQSLAEANLTAPITGTVGAVDVAPGQVTSTGSTTPAVTIVTQHTFEAEGLVTPTQVPTLALGDAVHLLVDGRPAPIAGRVTRIGPVDTVLGFQYPVVVALPVGIPRLYTGSLCQMAVVVHVAEHTLAVPTSAVHTTGGHSSVTVLAGGRTHRQPVAVGIVGLRRTQILSGLRPGEQVVLAMLGRPLPKAQNATPAGRSRTGFVPSPYPGARVFLTQSGNAGAFVVPPGRP